MNALILIGMRSSEHAAGIGGGADACALLLFVSGLVSLAVATYLLLKVPPAQPVRYVRRSLR